MGIKKTPRPRNRPVKMIKSSSASRSSSIMRHRAIFRRKIFIPDGKIILIYAIIDPNPRQTMKQLTSAHCPVSMGPEMFRYRHCIFQNRRLSPVLIVIIQSRCRWPDPGKHAGPRRIARWRRTVGISKQHTSLGQFVQIMPFPSRDDG